MQWFTEVMELFFISMELIKTLNLYFVWIFGHNKGWPAGLSCLSVTLSDLEYAKRSRVYTTQFCSWVTPQLLCDCTYGELLTQVLRVGGFCQNGVGDSMLLQQIRQSLYLL
uniref:Uncharacterized protein n=1 Tax=Mus spicilegus TaxID=10103 RepID=A0A8C6GYC8_MUSSI